MRTGDDRGLRPPRVHAGRDLAIAAALTLAVLLVFMA